MDNPNEALSVAALVTSLAGIVLLAIKQLAPSVVKRWQSKLETTAKDETTTAETDAAEDKLSIEAKSFLTEAAKDHLDSIRNMAQACQDEVKALRKEILDARVETASLQAKEEVRLEEIQRIRNDYIEAKGNLNEAKNESEAAKALVSKLQDEMSGMRQEMDRMGNQISVLESRLMSEQQNTRFIEQRLEAAEAELKVKDELLRESRLRNDKLSQDVRDLQRKLREYAEKLHAVENGKDGIVSTLDTKELMARDYDDFSVTTQTAKPEPLKAALEAIKPVVEEIKKTEAAVSEIMKPEEPVEVQKVSSEYKKPITKKIPPVEQTESETGVKAETEIKIEKTSPDTDPIEKKE